MRKANSGLPRVTPVTDIALETVYALLQEILDAVVHEALEAGLLPHVRKMSHLLAPAAWGDVA